MKICLPFGQYLFCLFFFEHLVGDCFKEETFLYCLASFDVDLHRLFSAADNINIKPNQINLRYLIIALI